MAGSQGHLSGELGHRCACQVFVGAVRSRARISPGCSRGLHLLFAHRTCRSLIAGRSKRSVVASLLGRVIVRGWKGVWREEEG